MRTALVGCGGIAAVHAAVLKNLADCEIVGFADIIPERAQRFAAEYGGNAYASLEEMLEAEKPEVLHICTPHYLHVPMAVYALEHHVHVFMEKPPVISWQQLAQLEEAVQKSDKKLGVCFQNRYNPCVQAVKELLASGEAGKIKGARAFVTWNRQTPYYTESGWRGSLATEGGGALINQSVHTLDLLVYLIGQPVWTDAVIANHHLKGIIEVEDMMEANIRFADASAVFYATTAYCTDDAPLIELFCENMKIRMEDPRVELIYPDGTRKVPETKVIAPLGKGYWGSGHGSCIHDFHDAVKNNRPYPQELNGIKETTKLMLAMYESARKGHAVQLTETREEK